MTPSTSADKPSSRILMVTGTSLSRAHRERIRHSFRRIEEVCSPVTAEEVFSRAAEVTDYILGGPEYIDESALARMPKLRHIVLLGTGTPSFIDEAAAGLRDIQISRTAHLNADSVAEFAVGAIILNSANAIDSADGVRTGKAWLQTPRRGLNESCIGIIGLGRIGRALVHKLHALGARNVIYTSRTRKLPMEARYGLRFMPLHALVGECDIASLHVSYSSQTHHLFDSSAFSSCHAGFRLSCFSNPHTIDPVAAREALVSRRLSQIYMDGYYREWIHNHGETQDEEGLLSLPRHQFWATSHVAAQSIGVIETQLSAALEQLIVSRPEGYKRQGASSPQGNA